MKVQITCCHCGKLVMRESKDVRSINQFCSRRCSTLFAGNIKRANAAESFWSKVRRGAPNECWPWMGYLMSNGYGQVGWNYKILLVHRVAMSLTDGDWDNPMLVCHTCDNPPCCNPAHLWRGTHLDNSNDMLKKNRQRHVVPVGEAHGMAKLTASQVTEIRSSGLAANELAERFGVTVGHIHQIKSRMMWRHIP